MMSSLDTALADCLSEMEAGRSMEDCLSQFSTQASELRTLLTLSTDVRNVPVPRARPEVKAAQRQRMLAALETGHAATPAEPGLLERMWAGLTVGPSFRWAAVMALVVVLLLGGGWASVTAAARSLPGDLLHPVKLAHEWVQLSLAIDPGAKQQLREEFFWERLEETQGVLDRGRETEVAFAGRLTAMTNEVWQIEGFYVQLGPDTVILGEPALGRQVHVRAQAQSNGELVALRLQVQPVGEPEHRPGEGTRSTPLASPTPTPTLTLSPTTEILSDPAPAPSSTPVPTRSRPAAREETEVAPAKNQVPTWLQRFRQTPQPRSTRPALVPSLTAKPWEPLRSAQETAAASGTSQPLRLRTRLPEDTPQARPPRTRTPVPTVSQTVPAQPQPERTGMPGDPPGPKPERTEEPEPERPNDPRPEPPRPRTRATRDP